MASLFEHYSIGLWMPEVGGRGRQADQVAAVGERKSSWWPLAIRDQAAATPPETVRSEDDPPD